MIDDDGDVPDRRQTRPPQRIEWIVGGIAALLVAAMIGFLLVDAIVRDGREPVLSTAVESVEAVRGGRFRVTVRIANGGDQTAAGVEIEGEIAADGEAGETSGVTLDYVPAHSSATATLLFSRDPRRHRLAVTAKGFSEP